MNIHDPQRLHPYTAATTTTERSAYIIVYLILQALVENRHRDIMQAVYILYIRTTAAAGIQLSLVGPLLYPRLPPTNYSPILPAVAPPLLLWVGVLISARVFLS